MTTKIAEIPDRAACAAWSPVFSHPGVVAIGTKDSGGVSFEDTGGELELYDISFIDDETTKAPSLLASLKTSARFASILWAKPTSEISVDFPLGLILGGMSDGVLNIWDPQQLLEQQPSLPEDALLASVSFGDDYSAGSITALNCSPIDPIQLCVGASNGHVTIVDLADPRNPRHWDPAPAHKKQTSGITAVEWNTAVAHIVATAAGDGSVVVWDVKSQKSWCEIRAEQAGQAVADIHWNPAEGLHLLTASADDRNPVLRLWDLAASTSMPLATLPGHAAGLLSTSWCPHDQNLLLSCAKDHRTFLWDLATMQPISELPAESDAQHQQRDSSQQQQQQQAQDPRALFASSSLDHQKHLRVQVLWSPIKRGVALTCSLDRKVQIHSVLSLATKTGRPPAWMKPTACVSTGFGGMVVSCYSNQPNSRWLMIRTVQEQPEFAAQVVQQETERANSTALDFCKAQLEKMDQNKRKTTHPWGFMRVIFESNARQELLEHLNFTADDIAARAQELADGMGALTVSEAATADDDSAISKGTTTMSEAALDIVKKALLIGDFEAAVEWCFQSQNFADALLLASCGGAELWSKTQQRYFEQEAPKRPFLSIASAIIRNQLGELVTESDLAQWQETLAVLSTYGQSEEFPPLCIALGDRLEEAGDHESASNCYMCALHLEGAVRYWKEQVAKASSRHSGARYDLDALHDFCLKVSVLRQATGAATELPSDVCALFNQYAKVLADQGLYATAAKYSQHDPNDPSSQILRDRLYRSRASQRCYAAMGVAPEFPYTMVAVEQSRGQYLDSALREQKRQQEMQQQALEEQRKQQEATMKQERQQQAAQQTTPVPQATTDELPPGWIALQDPASGLTYYANQATGETTWDRPQPPAPAVSQAVESSSYHSQAEYAGANGQMSGSASVKSANSAQRSTKAALTSKYGDGFVTSSSHPELADKYGNIGTGNPYGAERPGTAAAVVGGPRSQNAPVSGSLNFDGHSLSGDHLQVKDALLGVAEALKAAPLNPVEKRQVSEAEKGIAILVKKLALGSLSNDTVGKVYNLIGAIMNRDFRTAMSFQTDLANHDWRDHKDWLKGMKILLQLASKKLN